MSQQTPGGKPPRQSSSETEIRALQGRITALELDRPKAFIQNDPVFYWEIDHGKSRNVGVLMFDPEGNQIGVTVQCLTENTVALSSDTQFSGTAIVF